MCRNPCPRRWRQSHIRSEYQWRALVRLSRLWTRGINIPFFLLSSDLSCFPLFIVTMSQNPHETSSISESNYKVIFHDAVEAYKRRTGKDLESDPLLGRLNSCNSPDTVLAMLREQIPGFDQSGSSDERLDERFTKWLNPMVHVLCTFSSTISGVVSLVSLSNVKVIHRG